MRKLFLAGVALLFSAPAFAADLAIAPAPVPVAYPSWTGLYIGVHAGAAFQNFSSASINDPNGFLASGTVAGNSALGAVGGLQAGYNWQFAPAWVAGVEGDISWTSLSDQRGAPSLKSGRRSAEDRCHLERAASWRSRAVVLPDNRRCHCAGLPWLSFSCPACGQFGSVDLRTLDRHPGASISSLILSVSDGNVGSTLNPS